MKKYRCSKEDTCEKTLPSPTYYNSFYSREANLDAEVCFIQIGLIVPKLSAIILGIFFWKRMNNN